MFMPPPLGFASDAWRPYIFNACLPGMDRHFAPCLAAGYPNLLSGEELVYPDFRLRLPRFVTDEHKATWLRLARVRLWGERRRRAACWGGRLAPLAAGAALWLCRTAVGWEALRPCSRPCSAAFFCLLAC